MNDTLKFDKYDINIAMVNERELYIKLIDTTSDICYEGRIDKDDLDVYCIYPYTSYPFYKCLYECCDITSTIYFLDIYNIIKNSFNRVYGNNVVITITSGLIRIEFVNISNTSRSIQFGIYLNGKPIHYAAAAGGDNKMFAFDMAKIYTQLGRINKLLDTIVSPVNDSDIETPICSFNWNICGLPYFNDSTYKEKIKLS